MSVEAINKKDEPAEERLNDLTVTNDQAEQTKAGMDEVSFNYGKIDYRITTSK